MAHKLVVNLDVFSSVPLYQQLVRELKAAIDEDRLSVGEKLASIRGMSKQLQISTITVRQALDRLVEDGYISAQHGSGHYVQKPSQATGDANAPADQEEVQLSQPAFIGEGGELPAPTAWSAEIRRLTAAVNERPFHPWWNVELPYDFRSIGRPAAEALDGARWDFMVQTWSEQLSQPGGYGDAQGMPELRAQVATWLNRTRHMDCTADDVFITSGAQQSRDLVARLLVSPGDKVVVEEPCSITDILAYQAAGARLVSVPQDAEGVQVDELNEVTDAKVAHLITTANFPTGAALSEVRQSEVLKWAAVHDAIIVEDAYGAGCTFGDGSSWRPLWARAAGTDLRDRVIYLGSFSQLLSPHLRLGFMVVPPWLHKACFRAKWLSDRHQPLPLQKLVLQLLQSDFMEQHTLKLQESARKRRQALLEECERWRSHLLHWKPVAAGYQQCLWFDENGVDDLLVFERAIHKGVGVIPLSPYYLGEESKSGIVLNFMNLNPEKIRQGMQILGSVIAECLE